MGIGMKVLVSAKLRSVTGPILGRVVTSPKGRAALERLVGILAPLPRPLLRAGLVLGFAYGLYDPEGFAAELDALADLPEVIWWALGAGALLGFGGSGPSGGAAQGPS